MARTKDTTPLDQRVCKRGHVGKYVERSTAIACTECELEKRRAIQQAVRAITPPKQAIPLNERVCRRGHVGKYVERANSSPACGECMKIAVAKYKVKADAVKTLLKYRVEATAVSSLLYSKAPLEQGACTCGCDQHGNQRRES